MIFSFFGFAKEMSWALQINDAIGHKIIENIDDKAKESGAARGGILITTSTTTQFHLALFLWWYLAQEFATKTYKYIWNASQSKPRYLIVKPWLQVKKRDLPYTFFVKPNCLLVPLVSCSSLEGYVLTGGRSTVLQHFLSDFSSVLNWTNFQRDQRARNKSRL